MVRKSHSEFSLLSSFQAQLSTSHQISGFLQLNMCSARRLGMFMRLGFWSGSTAFWMAIRKPSCKLRQIDLRLVISVAFFTSGGVLSCSKPHNSTFCSFYFCLVSASDASMWISQLPDIPCCHVIFMLFDFVSTITFFYFSLLVSFFFLSSVNFLFPVFVNLLFSCLLCQFPLSHFAPHFFLS